MGSEQYDKIERRISPRSLLILGLGGMLLVAFALSLSLGSVHIPIGDIVSVLFGGDGSRRSWEIIVHTIRLPKAITAILAGAALSVSGLQMQTLFRNPLADPFVLGINSGASLGVAIVVLAFGSAGSALLAGLGVLGDLSLAFAASLGSAVVLGCVLLVSRKVQSVMTLLILGLMFGYATSAFVSVLLFFSIPEQIQAFIIWTFGSFGGVTWRQMIVLAPAIVVGLIVAFSMMKPLNALLLGENYAQSMGVPVRRVRIWTLAGASILAGVTTAFCGPIAFLGLAVPHLCRSLLNTSDHRLLMPAVTLLGATLALLADVIARMPGTQVTLPLNAVTSLIGAPVVIWVILRRQNLNAAFAD
ncbi:MAG: iron ABC transporter permease [Candidatus Latescibacteria bacterium]|nr:iron ABC transporter permease [Candidatus Latescibacterota bacterium]MBT5831516.1 iron ABC transporter permease [Candidatus Latescibacterota bacterium]